MRGFSLGAFRTILISFVLAGQVQVTASAQPRNAVTGFVNEGKVHRGKDLSQVEQIDQNNLSKLFPLAVAKSVEVQGILATLSQKGVSDFIPTYKELEAWYLDESTSSRKYKIVDGSGFGRGTFGTHHFALIAESSSRLSGGNAGAKPTALEGYEYLVFERFTLTLARAYFNFKDDTNVKRYFQLKPGGEAVSEKSASNLSIPKTQGDRKYEQPTLHELVDPSVLKVISDELFAQPIQMQK